MQQYVREEMRLLFQVLSGLFLVFGFSYFLRATNDQFPWLALIGSTVGLTIIVFVLSGKMYRAFLISLLVFSVIMSVIFNWYSIFNVH
ncbi:hypothetical protein [Psychrobacillus sp. OK032]|uniref:hypothetical protein n=1 Tax=Psychrobacillus sp. OK032 TaxID=1884358 RepID=UPI0008C2399B|nr:hypothetical protein [Psychrobacillus sp. OK032]SER97676.1 hypothetical protein SAMN05518872_10312 [Psychrobacillus sp. OK032]